MSGVCFIQHAVILMTALLDQNRFNEGSRLTAPDYALLVACRLHMLKKHRSHVGLQIHHRYSVITHEEDG